MRWEACLALARAGWWPECAPDSRSASTYRVFVVRTLFVASMLLPGPQILAYVALWVIVPDEAGPGAG